jgi:hypothetical protein
MLPRGVRRKADEKSRVGWGVGHASSDLWGGERDYAAFTGMMSHSSMASPANLSVKLLHTEWTKEALPDDLDDDDLD